jgi:hypothetical protein
MSQRFGLYQGATPITGFQPALESDKAPDPKAQQLSIQSASIVPNWDRYRVTGPHVIHESPTSIEIDPLSQGDPGVPTGNAKTAAALKNVFSIPAQKKEPSKGFRLLQRWRGTVAEIRDDGFDAELRDQTNPSSPREAASFGLEELSEGDEELIRIGSVFYWCVGYEVSETLQRRLVSEIIFRRLPGWTRREISEIQKEASELEEFFGIQDTTESTTTARRS